METVRVYNRYGGSTYMQWDYEPDNNLDATKKAQDKLNSLGITDAKIYEVAPICFWYSTPEKSHNVEVY